MMERKEKYILAYRYLNVPTYGLNTTGWAESSKT